MKTVVQAGQTLLDIAVQEYGTIEAAFMLARTNDMGITDTLQAGQEIETPEKVYNSELADYCQRNSVCPATSNAVRLRIFTEQFTEQFK
jgi:hypothetical protein